MNFPRAPTAEAWTTLNEKGGLETSFEGEVDGLKVLPLWDTFASEVSKCFDELGILKEHQSGTIALVKSDGCCGVWVWTSWQGLVKESELMEGNGPSASVYLGGAFERSYSLLV